VRKYIRIKFCLAVVVGLLTGVAYWLLRVDLHVLFAIVTFVLYSVPHVGNTVAVLAPLPLVFLDPTKTAGDVFSAFVIPFIIHQLTLNLVEPKLLALSLDSHPIVVLLAVAFWTALWGWPGAFLGVPLTAVLCLVLQDVEHPFAQPIVKLLKGDFMHKKRVGATVDAGDEDSSPPSPSWYCRTSSDQVADDTLFNLQAAGSILQKQPLPTECRSSHAMSTVVL